MINGKAGHGTTEGEAAHSRRQADTLAGWLLFAVLLLMLAVLLARVVTGAAVSARMFTYPFQFDESEGMIVAETRLLDSGVNIYDKPGPDLFIAAPYPPLYYLLDWPLQHLAGTGPTFKAGRGISLLATAVAGACAFLIILVLTGSWLAGAIAAAGWWSLSLVTFWGSLVKPDMLALAFGLCGLAWVVLKPPRQVWFALPLFVAAFYTKQTAIAAAVATIAWLCINRFRSGVLFGVAYALSAVVPSVFLNWITGGGYFYHMFTIHDLPWFPGRFAEYITNLIATYWPLFVPGIAAMVGLLLFWFTRARPSSGGLTRGAPLLFSYLVMSFVAAIGTGTLGGNHNHLLDLSAACCLGLGMAVGSAQQMRPWQLKLAFAGAGVVLLAFIPSLFATPSWLKQEFSLLSQDKQEGLMNIFQYVTNRSGQAYSDNVGLMLATGKKLWTTDPFTQTHATFYHRWDESRLVAAIRARAFSQIVLRIDIFSPTAGAGDVSPGILQAVRDNYKLDQRNVENIYVPR